MSMSLIVCRNSLALRHARIYSVSFWELSLRTEGLGY